MEDNQTLYTTKQAAEQLGISDNHMRTMIVQGKAKPKQKFGNAWMFTLDEIERLRTRNTKTGPPKKVK